MTWSFCVTFVFLASYFNSIHWLFLKNLLINYFSIPHPEGKVSQGEYTFEITESKTTDKNKSEGRALKEGDSD